jgi:hypothetical protein
MILDLATDGFSTFHPVEKSNCHIGALSRQTRTNALSETTASTSHQGNRAGKAHGILLFTPLSAPTLDQAYLECHPAPEACKIEHLSTEAATATLG